MVFFRPGKCLLHALLSQRNLTPQEFANQTEYSKQEISDYANNRRIMSLSTAKTIAHKLGVQIEELYNWETGIRSRQKQS